MTIVESAARAMRRAQTMLDGRAIRVQRGSRYFDYTATIGETRTDEVTEENTLIASRYRNYFIDVAAYNFGSGPVKPDVGDRITDSAGNCWLVSEDLAGEAWSYSDPSHSWYRIYVVRASE